MGTSEYRFYTVCSGNGLTDREVEVLKHRVGVGPDGPTTLVKVGELYGVSRERIRQIEASAKAKLPDSALKEIYALYPQRPSLSAQRQEKKRQRKALKEYLDNLRDGPISFQTICQECGIPEDGENPKTEQDVCYLLYKRLGLRYFQRYKLCSRCETIQPTSNFYKSEDNSGGVWTICKDCNVDRCFEWAKNNREHINKRRREWYRENPEKARAATKRWEERVRQGIPTKPKKRRRASNT